MQQAITTLEQSFAVFMKRKATLLVHFRKLCNKYHSCAEYLITIHKSFEIPLFNLIRKLIPLLLSQSISEPYGLFTDENQAVRALRRYKDGVGLYHG